MTRVKEYPVGSNLELLCFRSKLPTPETPLSKAVSWSQPAGENVENAESREKDQVKWGKWEPPHPGILAAAVRHTPAEDTGTQGCMGAGGGGYSMLTDLIPQAARHCLCQIHHNRLNYVRLNQLIKVASQVYNEGFSFI